MLGVAFRGLLRCLVVIFTHSFSRIDSHSSGSDQLMAMSCSSNHAAVLTVLSGEDRMVCHCSALIDGFARLSRHRPVNEALAECRGIELQLLLQWLVDLVDVGDTGVVLLSCLHGGG